MSARPLIMLMGVAVITIAPVPTFAEFEKTEWDVQDLYKQCTYKGSLDKIFCLEFVSGVARQVFTNGLELKDRHSFEQVRRYGHEKPSARIELAGNRQCRTKGILAHEGYVRL